MIDFHRLLDFYVRGKHRLESLTALALGSKVAEAAELYGEPLKSEPSEDSPEIVQHTFAAGDYHAITASEWKGVIQSITYWSTKSDPVRDLQFMLNAYRGGSDWEVLEEGYWYQRQDGVVRLWCSAMPAIGVAYTEFLRAKGDLKTAHELSKLDLLPDFTWASNNVVFELQRMHVEDGSSALAGFAARSESIAASPDGRTVLIVRNHHAFDEGEGFRELNAPPEQGNGYASQVINCFCWSEDGSSWSKVTLPRDARVKRLCFAGELCQLEIQQADGPQSLRFEGTPRDILRLGACTSMCHPLTDEGLWKVLREAECRKD
ncbi:hypothetical protein [Prosthecobacter sp.]|uniref:hypothetical protein n=1 Tax=Prosthecobacter sp. TaxID=1965333 RepID=UPI003784116F